MNKDMLKLKEMFDDVGLVTSETNNRQYKGNSCNVRSWIVFRAWINKSNHLTVRTRGIQRSFNNWTNKAIFKDILIKFEIL